MSCTDVLQIENQIQGFYKGYMEAFNTSNDEQEQQLIQRFLTPEMREKRRRLICATDADPMVRAQDMSDYAIQSVRCKHLEGNWYEISFRFYPQDSLECIPLRVTGDGEQVRISYVTPYWGGRKYGDELFDIDKVEVDDRQDAKTFVETFYKSYAYYYVKMVPDLEQELERLRKTYCTSGMEEKYGRLKEERKWEEPSYDPVIGKADFDAFWYKSLQVSPTTQEGCFLVSYAYTELRVSTQCVEGKYRISDIEELP